VPGNWPALFGKGPTEKDSAQRVPRRRPTSLGGLRRAESTAIHLGVLGAHPRVAALNALGHLAAEQHDHVQASARLEEALALARSVHDRHGVGHALVTRGQLALAQGEYDRAVSLLEESRVLFADLENAFGLWRALNRLG